MILVAYRPRGSFVWTHYFSIMPQRRHWLSFYRHCRVNRQQSEYARIVPGCGYVPVL